jgi:TDG/mug DNA glycosylase family protein
LQLAARAAELIHPAAMPLKDILIPRAAVLFVGINPSLRSEQAGHHFAGPGNPFWRLMHAAKLIPEPLTFAEDQRLAEFGLALTNLCPRATRAAAELLPGEIELGKRVLARKIKRVQPAVVAFVGVSIYRNYFGKSGAAGAGLKAETIWGARVFVLPNPSGLNASFPGFKDKLIWFQRLRKLIDASSSPQAQPAG